MAKTEPIKTESEIAAPIERVWEVWTKPEHIINWAFASDDWEAPNAENDLKVGGRFKTVMAAKDKSASFDFTGTYTDIKEHELIEYNIDDGRHVKAEFKIIPDGVHVTVTFDPEKQNTREMQQSGWQGILDNFKKYTESI